VNILPVVVEVRGLTLTPKVLSALREPGPFSLEEDNGVHRYASVMNTMKLVVISVLSWLAGLVAYLTALSVLWRQTISPGDLQAVAFWSSLAAVVAIAMVYVPVMFALRERLRTTSGWNWLLYTLVGVALGGLEVLFIAVVWSRDVLGSLFSPEARLFLWMSVAFGGAFGSGFFIAFGARSNVQLQPRPGSRSPRSPKQL
jgi:hypothetical protein